MAQPTPEPSRRYWPAGVNLPHYPRLDADRTVDVVVIGAGLTGITTAFALKEAGLTVALVERRRVGGVDTASTTAHLTAFADAQPSQLVSRFGVDDARLVWDAGAAAIDHIATRVESLGIDCGFRRVPGFYHVPFDADEAARDGGRKLLDEEAAALQKIGIPVERLDAAPLVTAPALGITEAQARFHPLRYLAALVALIPGHGSFVVEGDMAMVADTPGVVACGPHVVRAGHVVFATHNPMQGSQSLAAASLLQTNLALYTSYALRARLANDPGIEGLFWDTSDPYRYVRVDRTADGVDAICGGEDHKTGQAGPPLEHREALARWVAALFPGASIAEQWSGQVIEPADGLPMVGEVAEREYIATGYAGNGTTFGTIAALIIRDGITGRPNRFAERFAVGRTRFLRQPIDYVRENIDYPYHVVRDWLARNPPSDILASLAPGEGRLVDIEGTVMAASRDDDGRLSLCGSVCTHLGCRVGWNAAERTWDCPCHGSRFAGDGHVIAGPAERDL